MMSYGFRLKCWNDSQPKAQIVKRLNLNFSKLTLFDPALFCSLKKLKNALVFLFVAIPFLRVEEYIIQGKDSFLIDSDPNLLYTSSENLPSRVRVVLLLIQTLVKFVAY